MSRDRRQPDAIRRKQQRRTPEEIEELRKRRRRDEMRQYEEYDESRVNRRKDSGDGRRSASRTRRNKKSTKKKILVGILVAVIAVLGFLAISIGSFLGKIKGGDIGEAIIPTPDESVDVLILGLDIGDPNQTNNYDIKRTDTIMVAQYNPKLKDLDLVSIPRDTLVTENGRNYKINAAYQKGESKVRSLVEKLLGIQINYTVKVDYNAFRQFIDAIGGVDMEIERDMYYDDASQDLHINFKGGTVEHLDGKKAEEFFRWRKNNDGTGLATGDIGRIENQHKFIQKVVEKCTSPSIVLKVPSIIDAIGSNIQTNMPSGKLLSYALDVAKIDSSTVKMWTLQGDFKTIGGQSYVVMNKNYNKELLKALHNDGDSTIDKTSLGVLVLNGTKINGLAGEVKSKLELSGWTIIDVGNANPTAKSIIHTNNEEIKKVFKKELPNISKYDKKLDDIKYEQYDAVIILGEDYKKLGE